MEELPPAWIEVMQRDRNERIEQLTVGQRVRIDFGECPRFLSWHGTAEMGLMGTILAKDETGLNGAPADHPYWVLLDRPIRTRQSWNYSAAELTPITTEEWMAATLALLTVPEP